MVPKQKRLAIYLRTSQADGQLDNQRIDLERVAQQRGWDLAEIYVDHGVSGKRGGDFGEGHRECCWREIWRASR